MNKHSVGWHSENGQLHARTVMVTMELLVTTSR